MGKNIFYSAKMVSDQVVAYTESARAEVNVADGALVVLGNLAADTTYSATGVDYNIYEAAAPTATTDEVVIVDYAGISEGTIMDNQYRIGKKLYGLTVPAGTNFRVRRLNKHDRFWIGEDNFVATPTVGNYAGVTANSTKFTAGAALPASGLGVKVLVERDLTTGMRSNGKMYLVEVVQL